MTIHQVDNPPVAGTESGGPKTAPPLYVPERKFEYNIVPGFFLQDNGDKNVEFETDIRDKSFGMLDQSPERWANFQRRVEELQATAPPGVQYKVFFLGRHGQGWHNFCSDKYGVEQKWESEMAFVNGDGEFTWGPDPSLTPLGHDQTKAVGAAWKREAAAGAPVDKIRFFTSPLQRTCQTMINSWGDMLGPPETWEDFREIYGSHTCDKRSPARTIRERFPMVKIEPGFTEEDELWLPDDRETDAHMQLRARRYMDRIFAGEAPETYISITGHGAIFRNLLVVLGHKPWPLSTGEMIPVVVKATRNSQTNGDLKN
ncbi:hypothetical protein A1Q1_05425 [Trichosporon asahii var. asahii CBS 2479]|uniref:Phosphoglycerate mutase n=1 Tax=Trichosporon asahii var. asahii (strain ATCC 90039 / CBS 2479 / JCM 2466 / KCTC 7840 / NBRC 103889/ NCYC 2677 / UAMH 7654) TaxID=1186058 RepID=J5Q8M3_TRIAS|nr:hypothetical protein A1Q1_05425 [Trichosporon asahii var. asahii CBS 2479]EJT46043.1 hypothetical protein A1Q1_05425 [Trichosporon asahii var. asahii CBS 2479]